MKRALLIGSNGTIGQAMLEEMSARYNVTTLNRTNTDYSDCSLRSISEGLKVGGQFTTIICCIGVLHNECLSPEKRLSDLDETRLLEYFRINTILPALCLKYFIPLLERESESRFALLSAMVGSISDNSLGGWYGYRSSKAALNMIVKTASIELARTHKKSAVAVIHPGTTIGSLTRPFAAGIDQDKYYSPQITASRVLGVAESLSPARSGHFYSWDGAEIPW